METDEVDITEIVELRAAKVSGVGRPANGTPFLLLKAAKGDEEGIPEEVQNKIDAKENAEKSDSLEADAQQEEMTGETAKSDSAEADAQLLEMTGEAAKEEWDRIDKALSAADREKMPESSFAFVDKKGGKHLPIHDKDHAVAAKGRVSGQDFSEAKGDPDEAKAKAESKIESAAKKFGASDAKKGDVQDSLGGTGTPAETGHLATGQSQTAGSVTDGIRTARSDASYALGGETTANIPDATKVDFDSPIPASTDGAGVLSGQTVNIAKAVADLVGAMDLIIAKRAAIKDGKYLQVNNASIDTPDVPLTDVASTLAGCVRTLEQHLLCERVEAAVDPSEQGDVWDMEDAKSALECALRLVANIAIMESLEGEAEKGEADPLTKAYKRLTVGDTGALRTARDHLSAVIEGAEAHAAKNKASSSGEDAEKEILHMADVTKGELAEAIVAGVDAAFERRDAARKAAKEEKAAKRAAEEAEKNANNGGEISEGELKPTKEVNSDNINAVKSEGEEEHELDPATKQLRDDLELAQKELRERLDGIEGTLSKIAKRPRAGGPSLDGQARGANPAAEGRLSDVTKASDGSEIEALQKQLDEATDPAVKSEIGLRLTRARLTKAHEDGRL